MYQAYRPLFIFQEICFNLTRLLEGDDDALSAIAVRIRQDKGRPAIHGLLYAYHKLFVLVYGKTH